MNEETTTPETVELDTDIVKEALVDSTLNNAEYDIKTPYVTRTVNVPQQMRIPLYVNGQLKSTEELAELGLSIRQYTRLEVETAYYADLYARDAAGKDTRRTQGAGGKSALAELQSASAEVCRRRGFDACDSLRLAGQCERLGGPALGHESLGAVLHGQGRDHGGGDVGRAGGN